MEQLLTPAQLADLLGLSVQTIYNRHCIGASLPQCVRLGRVLRFPKSGVEAWVASQIEQSVSVGVEVAPRRPGRPSKAEQVRVRAGALK